MINPIEDQAAAIEILGKNLSHCADLLRADGDERYVEAATRLDEALDLVDLALDTLKQEV